jgi:hypothetical protein
MNRAKLRLQLQRDITHILARYDHWSARTHYADISAQMVHLTKKYRDAIGDLIDTFNARMMCDVSNGKQGKFVVRVYDAPQRITVKRMVPAHLEKIMLSVSVGPNSVETSCGHASVVGSDPSYYLNKPFATLNSTVTKLSQECRECAGRGIQINDVPPYDTIDCLFCDGTGIIE